MTLEDLKKLRISIKETYKLIIHEELELPNSKDEEAYEAFRLVIKSIIGVNKYVPEIETLRKIFYDDKYLSYSNKSLKPLRDFIRVSNSNGSLNFAINN